MRNKKKALIISVGTGTKVEEKAVESLVHGIAFSILNSNPDKLFLVVTRESEAITLPKVLEGIDKEKEVIRLEDPDDVEKICQTLSPKFKEIRDHFLYLTVDYTSGTKAMTAALVVLGSLWEADTLSYVAGKREGGIVVRGTEKILHVQPCFFTFQKELGKAKAFFNNFQFSAALGIIDQLKVKTRDSSLLSELSSLETIAQAYSLWDKFKHEEAYNKLMEIKDSRFNANKSFLGRLAPEKSDREVFYIVDLISNARRRGEYEAKYDDAVARLYRTIELIAQYRLRKNYGIENTGDVPPDKIPPDLVDELKPTEGKIKIGLDKDYQLLAAKGDDMGKKFIEDKKLKDLLKKRNDSILAHGLSPVSKEDFEELKDKTIPYAQSTVIEFDQLLSDSTFVSWPT